MRTEKRLAGHKACLLFRVLLRIVRPLCRATGQRLHRGLVACMFKLEGQVEDLPRVQWEIEVVIS